MADRRGSVQDPDGARPHDLRHFRSSVLVRSGSSRVLVARLLGHSSPRVTHDIYSHLLPFDLDDMAMRLDRIRGDVSTQAAARDIAPSPRPVG